MIVTDLSTIDLTKYKRLFAFGCSFTFYIWPTWANIMQKACPDAEFYNYGQAGGGQEFIASSIVEANAMYKFNNTDLILVMWSTYNREDRYTFNRWETPGNIYTQQTYDDAFVKKFSCTRGYLIKSLTMMTLAQSMLSTVPSDAVVLHSVPVGEGVGSKPYPPVDDVLRTFSDIISDMPMPLLTALGGYWRNGHVYRHEISGQPSKGYEFGDYHPNPADYYEYLTKIGFKLPGGTEVYARDMNDILKKTRSLEDIRAAFPEYHGLKFIRL